MPFMLIFVFKMAIYVASILHCLCLARYTRMLPLFFDATLKKTPLWKISQYNQNAYQWYSNCLGIPSITLVKVLPNPFAIFLPRPVCLLSFLGST